MCLTLSAVIFLVLPRVLRLFGDAYPSSTWVLVWLWLDTGAMLCSVWPVIFGRWPMMLISFLFLLLISLGWCCSAVMLA